WCTTTMISSVRLDGRTACMAIEGATTGEVFREYVRHVLLPTLRPGDIVVMDNLSAHKDAEAIDLNQDGEVNGRDVQEFVWVLIGE
ncbi:MAG: transposase, partial [Planctomycetota bacterium]